MVFIYVLQLEQRKYYIGKTNNPTFRLENHFNSNGSAWTKKYKPIKVLELIPDCDDYDEDKHTRKYMDKYGIDNVRGGSFCEINLNENNIATLNQMSNGTNNKCFTCGSEEHFANNCNKKEKLIKIDNSNAKCNCTTSYFSPHRRSKCLLNNLVKQTKKYFEESSDDECEEIYDDECVWCCEYCDRTFTTTFGAGVHEKSCKEKNSNQDTCFRCGREGHYATNCYASKHIKGYYLK